MEQEALVRAAQGGDREALGELVRRYHGPLTAYLTRLGGDRELALDLAQEAFCRVCLGIGSLASPAAFRVWLYRTAYNLYLDHRRSWYHRRVAALPQPPAGGRDPGPEEELVRREEGERVRRALASLSAAHRAAILLRYYEEMTLDEIARVTGTPVGTVKSRLHYAQRVLARRLAPDGPRPALAPGEVGRWQRP